jgi:Zn-dependent protease with chaperone function/Flp pilus assembly protein TadD
LHSGFESMAQKSISLALLIAICVWLVTRSFLPVLTYDEHDDDGVGALYDSRTSDPIESLSRVIDRQTTEPQSAERLAEAYRTRGSFLLQRHEPQQALADFDSALRLNPSELAARFGRAECYRQLGDFERANAEMQQAGTIDLSDAFPGLKHLVSRGANLIAFFSTAAGVWLLVAIAWAIMSTFNLLVGWRQTAEASGSLWRLSYVAAGLGVLEILPLGVWAMLVVCQRANLVDAWLVPAATFISLVATVPMLRPPIRFRGTKTVLPRVNDEVFLNRIAELARSMHVPVPLVRLRPSITGSQQALAYVGCLPAPQLVVSDGVLQRLSPAERDAVVAHELGHLANGSLWLLTAVIPVTCAIATGVSHFVPLTVAIPFGFALGTGLRRIVSRPLELDADHHAACAAGFQNTSKALAKIHAVNSLGESGLIPQLAYATSTHPSRAVRLSSLKAAAPSDDLPEIAVCAQTVRRHRIAARAALIVWLLTLVVTLTTAVLKPDLPFLALPLWIATLTPTGLMLIAQKRQISVAQRRLGRYRIQTALLFGALLAVPVLGSFPDLFRYLFAPLTWFGATEYVLFCPLILIGITLAVGTGTRRRQASRRLRGEMAIAFQVHDFKRVLELGTLAPAAVAKDSWLRYHMAFARALCGERTAAITQFEELWRDAPRFPLTGITLSALLLDGDQPERALEVASRVAQRLPSDAAPHLLVARSLRRLGRLAEAHRASERALALEPRDGVAHAVAAAIALDSGDFSRAQQLIDTALELAPGEVYVLLVRAEVALKTQLCGDPRAAVEEGINAVRSNPFAFYHVEVSRLKRWLAEFEGTTCEDESDLLVGLA